MVTEDTQVLESIIMHTVRASTSNLLASSIATLFAQALRLYSSISPGLPVDEALRLVRPLVSGRERNAKVGLWVGDCSHMSVWQIGV